MVNDTVVAYSGMQYAAEVQSEDGTKHAYLSMDHIAEFQYEFLEDDVDGKVDVLYSVGGRVEEVGRDSSRACWFRRGLGQRCSNLRLYQEQVSPLYRVSLRGSVGVVRRLASALSHPAV